MTDYTAVMSGIKGVEIGDPIQVMQNSIITDISIAFINGDGSLYVFEAGDAVTGVFLPRDAGTQPEYGITGTITPSVGLNTASWARAAEDVGTPNGYIIYFIISRGVVPDVTTPVNYDVLFVPGEPTTPPTPLVSVTIAQAAWLAVQTANGEDVGDKVSIDGSNAKTGVYPQWRFWVQPQAIEADEVIIIPSDHQMVVFGGLAIEAGGQLIIEAGGKKITPPL